MSEIVSTIATEFQRLYIHILAPIYMRMEKGAGEPGAIMWAIALAAAIVMFYTSADTAVGHYSREIKASQTLNWDIKSIWRPTT